MSPKKEEKSAASEHHSLFSKKGAKQGKGVDIEYLSAQRGIGGAEHDQRQAGFCKSIRPAREQQKSDRKQEQSPKAGRKKKSGGLIISGPFA